MKVIVEDKKAWDEDVRVIFSGNSKKSVGEKD